MTRVLDIAEPKEENKQNKAKRTYLIPRSLLSFTITEPSFHQTFVLIWIGSAYSVLSVGHSIDGLVLSGGGPWRVRPHASTVPQQYKYNITINIHTFIFYFLKWRVLTISMTNYADGINFLLNRGGFETKGNH